MKKMIALAALLGLVGVMLVNFITEEMKSSRTIDPNAMGEEVVLGEAVGLQQGQTAPDFTLATLDGKNITLSELKGKNVILNFWASWCGPCKSEMPDFQTYYKKYAKQQNVEIVAVNMTFANDSRTKVAQFIESFDLTFPIVLEETEGISKTYEVVAIPSTLMIDAQGKVQRYIRGPLNTANLQKYVEQLNN